MQEWSSYPTAQVAKIFYKSSPANQFLVKVVTQDIDTDQKAELLLKYIDLSVTRRGAFFQVIDRHQIAQINWYEIIRRSNELIRLLN